MYRLDEESQKGNTWSLRRLARLQALLNRGTLSDKNCANPLLIRASVEIQCPIELGCWRIEFSLP